MLSVSSRGVAFRQVEGPFVERSSVSCREEYIACRREEGHVPALWGVPNING